MADATGDTTAGARYTVSTSTSSPVVYTITDTVGGVEAGICLARGAELCSLRMRLRTGAADDSGAGGKAEEEGAGAGNGWTQLLDRANDFSKPTTEWSGRGQHLFPAVGRTYIDDTDGQGASKFIREGELLTMPLHGFIKDVEWHGKAVVDADGARVECSVSSADLPAEVVKHSYPFPFDLSAVWSVRDGVLQFLATVTATGDAVVPFSIGNHIALKFPFIDDETSSFDAGVLRGSVTQQLGLSPLAVLDGTVTRRPELNADGLTISVPANRDTVLGGAPDDSECYLELVQPGKLAVRVTHLTPSIPKTTVPHRYFVLWGEPHYMCPEPWLGAPSSLSNGKGLIELEPGTHASWGFTVSASGPCAPEPVVAAASASDA